MGQEFGPHSTRRRFPRVHGPFFAYYDTPERPVLVYDLNLGGGFVNFGDEPPSKFDFVLCVALPYDGLITVNAETVYRHESGVAVRFVDMDADTRDRLARTVGGPIQQPVAN